MAAERNAPTVERLRLLALCAIEKVNWNVLARAAQRPGGMELLMRGEVGEQSRDGRLTEALIRPELEKLDARIEQIEDEIGRAAEDVGARLVTILDEDYPVNLRVIHKPPPFLFYRGSLDREKDARSVAVVGTRKASEVGLDSARNLARMLTEQSVTVMSGLAKGIDTAAHRATLEAGGRTVAVLGTGILTSYPKENADLTDEIAERGAVVSQFWPTAPPTRYSFPMRNEVMSGICQGTAVIEATSTSGAKMQARLALEQGKRAFLLASLVTSENWAKKYLAERGAIEVKSVEDIVRWLKSPEQVERQSAQRHQLVMELA